MRRRLLVLAASCLIFVSADAKPRKAINSLEDLGADETVVVGRVELVPALHKTEQQLRGPMSGRYVNKMFLIVDAEPRELTEEPGIGDFKGRIDAALGEDFMVRSSNEPFYVVAGMMLLTMDHGAMDKAYFPGGLKANIRPGDKAVYIGTIRYHRNEFFEVTRTLVIDDYDRVRRAFEERLGRRYPLRKALLRPVR